MPTGLRVTNKARTAEVQCATCGELNPADSNFCSTCGGSEFREVPPGLAARLSTPPRVAVSPAVRISLGRVIAISMLSAGPYLIYWFYLTWKQMDSETGEEHHPVWHALGLLVPIYGLFEMHGHIKVIKGLVEGAGLVAALSPGLAVVLFMIGNALDWSSFRVDDTAALLVMGVISAALSTTLVALAQNALTSIRRTPGARACAK